MAENEPASQTPPPPKVVESSSLHSAEIDKIVAALAKAQGTMEAAKKNAFNPHFGKPYSDLSDCWAAARESLSKNELAVIQLNGNTPNGDVSVTTILAHASGQWFRSRLALRPVKPDPQGVGSAITYGRRYGFNSIVGISEDENDDDGNGASGRDQEGTQESRPPQAPQVKPSQHSSKKAAPLKGKTTTSGAPRPVPKPAASEDDVPENWDQSPEANRGPGAATVKPRDEMNQRLMPLWRVYQENHKDIKPPQVLSERYQAESVGALSDEQLADLIAFFENDNAANARKGKKP